MIVFSLCAYFALILLVSRWVADYDNNDTFFCAGRSSYWGLVAFGMIGASISGLTFIGVPGWVMTTDMTYLQMCIGFIFGYIFVAFVLLPLYYRMKLTSIYTYLDVRFGKKGYKTGATFFILSKLLSAAAKFYIVVRILQVCVADEYGIPYAVTAALTLFFIWLYTHRSGMKSLVWTDVFQTFFLITALILIMLRVCSMLEMNPSEAFTAVMNDPHSRIFEWDDFVSRQNFWKQFLSGVFVVIVMTGLDQDMMQKNLTCRSLCGAQMNMCTYGVMFLPVNFLFLALGILLLMLYGQLGMELPASGDELLSGIIFSGALGEAALMFFTIGVVASALSSADSALTALTTSFCVDILDMEKFYSVDLKFTARKELVRKRVHIFMMLLFLCLTLLFNEVGSGSVMDLIYTIVSYTYGPLLGLFAYGLLMQSTPKETGVMYVAIASPLVCLVLNYVCKHHYGYEFGYEMLMLNGLLTFVGLWLLPRKPKYFASEY